MRFLLFLTKRLARWGRRQLVSYRCFAAYGIELPVGSVLERISGIEIGSQFTLGEGCRLYCHDPENGSRLTIGDNVALNDNVTINADCGGDIEVSDNAIIGPGVIIRAANHRYLDPDINIRDQGHEAGTIKLEQDVWLGANVTVLPNVTIGQGSVVGAGSVVTRDIPPYSIAVGVPARVIGKRDGRKLSEQEIST